MKVYTPKRVLKVPYPSGSHRNWHDSETGASAWTGVPLDGDWATYDDYFHQVSSGNHINDVVHAKVVDSYGGNYSIADLSGVGFPQTVTYREWSLRDVYAMRCPHRIVQRVDYRLPTNYKGRKKLKPRRYVWHERVGYPVGIHIDTDAWINRGWGGRINIVISLYFPTKPLVTRGSRAEFHTLDLGAILLDESNTSFTHVSLHRTSELIDWSALQGLLNPARWVLYKAPPYKERIPDAVRIIDALSHQDGLIQVIEAIQGTRKNIRGDGIIIDVSSGEPAEMPDVQKAFVLDEPEILVEKLDPMLLGKDTDFSNYWRNYLMQHAILSACESFPKLSDNSISNIMEIVGFIKALVVDHRIEIPKTLQSAWLAYRYQYSTSKMDVQDAVKFVRRHSDLGGLARDISCYGTAFTNYKGVDVTCRCEVTISPRNVKTLDKILRDLDTYGLTVDFYVIWDMIPYSFMVDWFLPISDVLNVWDANAKYFSGEFYDLKDVCYSLSYTRELDGQNVKCYSRWNGSVPSSLNSWYWLEPPSASSKTVVYRVLDAASIFVGR